MALKIFYDGECPVCARYIQMVRLSKEHQVSLINLRDALDDRKALEDQGFDVDQGMVVDYDGRLYGGADAVHILSLLSTPSGTLNRLSKAVLGQKYMAKLLYPLLRSGRWLLLFLLNKPLVKEDPQPPARQEIFTIFFSLFSLFHVFFYATKYARFPPSWDMLLLLIASIIALLKPQSSRLLAFLMASSLISAFVQAPVHSNHTITRNFLLLGYWLSFAYAALRNQPKNSIFNNFAVSGWMVILVMYFFGIFHKINADFLNPITSCAVALWKLMPWPLSEFNAPWVHASNIYGTFIAEGLIALALIIPRYRHIGIVAGIAFHLLLSFSGYALYIPFSMLSIAMHSLFLSEGASRRILASPLMTFIRSRRHNPAYLAAAASLLFLLGLTAMSGQWGTASRLALPLILPYLWLILKYGRPEGGEPRAHNNSNWIPAVIGIAFFINCSMPYLGLKTAQSGNMFANIRLEGGVSNHLVFSSPPRAFNYLNDVAVLEEKAFDSAFLTPSAAKQGMIYYDLLAMLADNPQRQISFSMNGQTYRNVSAADLQADIDAELHHPWVRKFFHFQFVQLERPEPCTT